MTMEAQNGAFTEPCPIQPTLNGSAPPQQTAVNGTETSSFSSSTDDRDVFFFDIDNCLYPKDYRIHDMMKVLIRKYFMNTLGHNEEMAAHLNETYYRSYGLALAGLVHHHQIDPMDYNTKVDDALPLENVLKPDPKLRKLLQEIDRTKIKPWLFTNAYKNHARRVVKLLGIEDLFEGLTFCDYREQEFVCKPRKEMYEKAMREAGVTDPSKCYFVDDSASNCRAAASFGWERTAWLAEEDEDTLQFKPDEMPCKNVIRSLYELKDVFPEVFKSEESSQ